MNNVEYRAAFGLVFVLFLRIFGIFMLLPVLTIHGIELYGATNKLVGIAIGIYGLTQSIFQIPFGILSDKFGHKKFIILGLLIFVLGNLVSLYKISIWSVILGRAIQGLGAITSSSMALLSDLLNEKNRTKFLGIIGIIFGISFSISMFMGPFIVNLFGIKGLFLIIIFLGILGIMITIFIVPSPNIYILNRDLSVVQTSISKVFLNFTLFRLNFSVFCLHVILMFNLLAFPVLLKNFGILKIHYWKLYFLIILISFLCSLPIILYFKFKRYIKVFFIFSLIMLFLSEILLYFSTHNFIFSLFAIQIFFIFFNIKEFLLPFILSYIAPVGYKGTVIGIFSTYQFFGSCLGSFIGGILINNFRINIIFFVGCIFLIIWFFLIINMERPKFYISVRFILNKKISNYKSFIDFLMKQRGVMEVLFFKKENAMYCRIDDQIINKILLKKIIMNYLS